MGLISKLKDLIKKRENKLLLESGNDAEMEDKTSPLICIETIEQILKDNGMFRKFKKHDKYFFENKITEFDYKRAIGSYVEFLLRRNVRFSKNELRRAEKITGKKYTNHKFEKKISQKEKAGEMLRDPEKMQKFIQNNNSTYEGYYTDDIKYELLEMVNSLPIETFGVHDENISKFAKEIGNSTTLCGDPFREYYKYRANHYAKVNEQLENLIKSKVPSGITDKEELAYCIYNAVNQCLEFDSTFFLLGRDREIETVRKIVNADVSTLSVKNNRTTCKRWAELYQYVLNEYGINAAVTVPIAKRKGKNGIERMAAAGHRNVEIYLDDQIITADATNVTNSDEDRALLTDLTREKMGIIPQGFESRNCQTIAKRYGKVSLKDYRQKIKEQAGYNENEQDTIEDVKAKLNFINFLIKQQQMGNWENYQYLKYLHSNLFDPTQKNKVRISESLYSETLEGQCDVKPIISIKAYEGENFEYRYAILNNTKEGLQSINKGELISAISSGKLKLRMGYKRIPGIDLESIEIKDNKKQSSKTGNVQDQSSKTGNVQDQKKVIQSDFGEYCE